MATQKLPTMLLSILAACLCVFDTVVYGQYDKFSKYDLPRGVTGPESVAFGVLPSDGPYTAVTDGRIMKWQGSSIGFVDFAYTTPTRSKQFCDGTTDPDKGPICGRPLGLSFQPLTGLLYIADAYIGFLVVGPSGGLATPLVRGFKFLAGVDASMTTDVYLTDASLTYEIRNTTQPGFQPDSTGRFLRYNIVTKQLSVLLSGLSGGGSPAVSSDGRFVLVPELTGMRILKYWLAGPKANTAELFLNTTGNPNKITRAERFGEFWVADSVGNIPRAPLIVPHGIRINSDGIVLQTVSFATQYFNKSVTSIQEQGRKLYVGARFANFVGIYSNQTNISAVLLNAGEMMNII